MRRFREDRPADICLARGTFNSHPYVMGAMAEFLTQLESSSLRTLYEGLEAWDERAAALNRRLAAEDLPVRVANLSSIWTIYYVKPSRYNWMYQYYLRAAGIALSFVGTGRLIFSLNYTAADYEEVADRLVSAAREMQSDGWWWCEPQLTNKAINRRVFKEMLQAWWASRPAASPMGSINSPRSKKSGALQ
jgi:glutamate-1-semialdehyde 2,1-aminomutase